MEDRIYADMVLTEGFAEHLEELGITEHMPEDILARYRYLCNFEKLYDSLRFIVNKMKNECYDEICKMPEPITEKWEGIYNPNDSWVEAVVDMDAFAKDHPELVNYVMKVDVKGLEETLKDFYPEEYEVAIIKLAEEMLEVDSAEFTKTASLDAFHKVLPFSEWEKYTKYVKYRTCHSCSKLGQDDFVVHSRGELHG